LPIARCIPPHFKLRTTRAAGIPGRKARHVCEGAVADEEGWLPSAIAKATSRTVDCLSGTALSRGGRRHAGEQRHRSSRKTRFIGVDLTACLVC
jgi:hypothetical protein